MSLSVFFLPMARVGAVVTMRLMMRSSVGVMQTDDTHCIHSFSDCVWRLVPSVTCFRVFRNAPSCLPIRASRCHFHAAICYFLIRDCHLHVSNCHLQVSNHHLHVIDGHLHVVQPYDNQCGRFLLGLDEGSERR